MIRMYRYGEVPNSQILARRDTAFQVQDAVSAIIAEVIARGDAALRDYTARFDGVTLESLEVSEAEFDEAMAAVEPEFLDILREAAANIRAYHEKQKSGDFVMMERDGVVLGQKITPSRRWGSMSPTARRPIPPRC